MHEKSAASLTGLLRYHVVEILLLAVLMFAISGCTENQNDIDLPVLDAIGGDFLLPSTLGRELSLSEYQGRVVLINFGYTHCPDICPMVLGRLAKLTKRLESERNMGKEHLQTLFITVDPERDTVPHLKEYLVFFNTGFIGLSGSAEQMLKVSKQYAAFTQKQPGKQDEYQVIHNDKIFLIDKRGRLRALYGKSDSDEKILNDIAALARAEV